MKRGIILVCLCSVLILGLVSLAVFAEVKPNGLISDNAVLQQGMRVPIWGTADSGEKVTVKFQNQQVTTTAHNGNWIVWLNPLKPGGPFTMWINDLEIKNILVGEVWLCSGQSNMAWPMSRVENAEAEIKTANDPMLRLYLVPKTKDPAPLPQAWKECTPESVANFSAVGYYFGQHLCKALKVPVGLIDSSVGGTPAESWTSTRALLAVPELRDLVGKDGGRPVAYLYRAMIQPLVPYAIKGVIWYQGESNASRAQEYRILLPTMIKCWRNAWAQGDFPFLIVQLAPYGRTSKPDTWPELREAQLFTAQTVPNTGIVVITDYGDCEDIHPKQKKPVGERLGLLARGIAYGEKIVYSGPIYRSMKIEGNKAILSFDWAKGLHSKGGDLKGFTVAGEDHNFVPAKAEIVGENVVVYSPEVQKPVAVRYGWSDCPDVNLFNGAGLPASPFRTDN